MFFLQKKGKVHSKASCGYKKVNEGGCVWCTPDNEVEGQEGGSKGNLEENLPCVG